METSNSQITISLGYPTVHDGVLITFASFKIKNNHPVVELHLVTSNTTINIFMRKGDHVDISNKKYFLASLRPDHKNTNTVILREWKPPQGNLDE